MFPIFYIAGPRSAVGNVSDCRSRGSKFDPDQSHAFLEIDHEILSTAILLPPADLRFAVSSK